MLVSWLVHTSLLEKKIACASCSVFFCSTWSVTFTGGLDATLHGSNEPKEYASAIQEGMEKLGLSYLKDKQKEAVETFLRGEDRVVDLPTGYGKITNICYSTICIRSLIAIC